MAGFSDAELRDELGFAWEPACVAPKGEAQNGSLHVSAYCAQSGGWWRSVLASTDAKIFAWPIPAACASVCIYMLTVPRVMWHLKTGNVRTPQNFPCKSIWKGR